MNRGPALLLLLVLAGCAMGKSAPPQPPAASPAEAPGQQGYPAAPQQEASPVESPSTRAPDADTAPSKSSTNGPATSGALAGASGEVDRAQREIEIAAGNCENACRALGSMDRATGKLCTLARSTHELDRCGDAKTRLQNARDRVKRTCVRCADVTVDRDAAIPSR